MEENKKIINWGDKTNEAFVEAVSSDSPQSIDHFFSTFSEFETKPSNTSDSQLFDYLPDILNYFKEYAKTHAKHQIPCKLLDYLFEFVGNRQAKTLLSGDRYNTSSIYSIISESPELAHVLIQILKFDLDSILTDLLKSAIDTNRPKDAKLYLSILNFHINKGPVNLIDHLSFVLDHVANAARVPDIFLDHLFNAIRYENTRKMLFTPENQSTPPLFHKMIIRGPEFANKILKILNVRLREVDHLPITPVKSDEERDVMTTRLIEVIQLGEEYAVLAKIILKFGAELIPKSKEISRTPLHNAIFFGNYAVTEVLLEEDKSKKSVNLPTKTTKTEGSLHTPLHYAVIHNQITTTSLLLANKADPLFPDKYKRTPVHLSVILERPEMFKLLVNHLQKDKNSSETIQKCFLSKDTKDFTIFHHIALKPQSALVDFLAVPIGALAGNIKPVLEAEVEVKIPKEDDKGKVKNIKIKLNPFLLAYLFGNHELIKFLRTQNVNTDTSKLLQLFPSKLNKEQFFPADFNPFVRSGLNWQSTIGFGGSVFDSSISDENIINAIPNKSVSDSKRKEIGQEFRRIIANIRESITGQLDVKYLEKSLLRAAQVNKANHSPSTPPRSPQPGASNNNDELPDAEPAKHELNKVDTVYSNNPSYLQDLERYKHPILPLSNEKEKESFVSGFVAADSKIQTKIYNKIEKEDKQVRQTAENKEVVKGEIEKVAEERDKDTQSETTSTASLDNNNNSTQDQPQALSSSNDNNNGTSAPPAAPPLPAAHPTSTQGGAPTADTLSNINNPSVAPPIAPPLPPIASSQPTVSTQRNVNNKDRKTAQSQPDLQTHLAAIRQGVQLKRPEERAPAHTEAHKMMTQAPGLLHTLSAAMDKRRGAWEPKEDNDSSSDFSDEESNIHLNNKPNIRRASTSNLTPLKTGVNLAPKQSTNRYSIHNDSQKSDKASDLKSLINQAELKINSDEDTKVTISFDKKEMATQFEEKLIAISNNNQGVVKTTNVDTNLFTFTLTTDEYNTLLNDVNAFEELKSNLQQAEMSS